MSIPENRTLRGTVIDYTSDRTLPLNEAKIYFSPVQAGEGTPSPENVREISGWDSVTLNVNSRLPSEYQEVEYIEGTGTQWIGIPLTKTLDIFRITGKAIFTAYPPSYNYYEIAAVGKVAVGIKASDHKLYIINTSTSYGYASTTDAVKINNEYNFNVFQNGTDLSIQLDSNYIYTGTTTTTDLSGDTLYIFIIRPDAYLPTEMKLFKFTVYNSVDDSKIICNLVPCYRISDHTPGMFDLVSNQFYTNSGTGNFILGPEVGITIDFPKTIYGGYVDLIRGEIVEEQSAIELQTLNWIGSGNRARANNSINLSVPDYNQMPNFISEKYYAAAYSTNLTNYTNAIALGSSGFIAYYDGETLPSGKMIYPLSTSFSYSISPQDLRLLRGANKFSSNLNGDIEISFAAEEYPQLSGNIITFNSPVAGKQFEECKVYFSPIQEGEGTPSPENVRPIRGWDGMEITRCGKNLIDPSQEELNKFINANGVLGILGGFTRTGFIPVKYGIDYTISGVSTYSGIATIRIHGYDEDNNYIKQVYEHGTAKVSYSYTFSIDDDRIKFLRISAPISDEFQLEIGSTKTSYTPYTDLTTITIPFDHTIYGGYVDLVNGEIVETHKARDIGDVLWSYSWGCFVCSYADMKIHISAKTLMSENYKVLINTTAGDFSRDVLVPDKSILGRLNYKHIGIKDKAYSTIADFVTANNGRIFVYPLETPLRYSLDIDTLTTLKNTNTLFSNANGNITVRAIGNVPASTHSMDFVRRENAAAPHIESKTGNYITFNTDMEMPLTSGKVYFSPKQDLHGYDKPWVGGAGKNKVNYLDPANWRVATNTNIRATEATIGSISASNGTVTLTRTSTYAGLTIILGQLKAGTTYTISGTFNCDGTAYIAKLDEEEITADYTCTRVATPIFVDGVVQFTPEEDGIYELLLWKTSTGNVSVSNLQLELGSTATAYEPYENICPIEGWDGITVNKTGKNLVDIQDMKNTYPWSNTTYKGYSLFVGSNKTITISHLTDIANGCDFYVNIGTRSGQKNVSNVPNNQWMYHKSSSPLRHKQITVTADNNGYIYINVYVVGKGLEQFYTLFLNDGFQIEYGDTATAWEPFNSFDTFTITFPKTIYGGYVDLVNKEVVETWNSKTIDGTNIQDYAGNGYNGTQCTNRYLTFVPNSSQSYQTNTAISNYLESKKYAIWSNANNYPNCFTINGGYQLHICFFNDIVGIVNDDSNTVKTNKIKAYLVEHPMQLVYPLKTADMGHYSLTIQTLTTLSGTNNFWTNSNGDAQISYYRHSDDSYQYVNAQAIASNNNYLLVTDDGFVIGTEENVTVY